MEGGGGGGGGGESQLYYHGTGERNGVKGVLDARVRSVSVYGTHTHTCIAALRMAYYE